MSKRTLWDRFKRYYLDCPTISLSLDVSRMGFDDSFLAEMRDPITGAFREMEALEKGAIANGDESRMVGHYWLRTPELSPTAEIRNVITQTVADIKAFAADVHGGAISAPGGRRFTDLLVVGIGGSALGPQFVSDALGGADDRMRVSFCDNTDPDGIDRTIERIGSALPTTMTVVISKSGGTAETRNSMLEVRNAYEQAGLDFSSFAVAITGEGSELDGTAQSDGWLKRFPMWDWVGGRTSETSAVGLLPAALQGIDIDLLLAGAAACDSVTRTDQPLKNPAAMLALMWFYAGGGHGSKDMVILPYKDRLSLFAKYLQQLVMESLGKKLDRTGSVVHQGISVYGNKGSTDQHAYVQQLRDGLNNFFVTFIEVTKDRAGPSIDVEEDVTSGDYLHGFLLGTRKALHEAGRESITLTVADVSPRSVGVLIALFERAVGFYASLIDVNAYHQPGVEAGKKAAADVIGIQRAILSCMQDNAGDRRTAAEWARSIDSEDEVETVFKTLQHLAANRSNSVTAEVGDTPFDSRYGMR